MKKVIRNYALLAALILGGAGFCYAQGPATSSKMAMQGAALTAENPIQSGTWRFGFPLKMMHVSLANAFSTGALPPALKTEESAIRSFYSTRGNQPFWFSADGNLQGQGHELVLTLVQSWQHGLNPDTYHAASLQSLANSENFADKAQLEILLTDGFAKYMRDISGMRIKPERLTLFADNWRQAPRASEILAALNSHGDAQGMIKEALPASATYDVMRQELVRLMQDAQASHERATPIDLGGRLLKPGMRDKAVIALRARMGTTAQTKDERLYDDALAAAVMAFQRDSNLKSDGVIGAQTLTLLNRSRQEKINQLIANMERLRWVKKESPQRMIVVNIPSATLWAIEEGRVKFEMPVIVGRPGRPTHSFIAQIEGVRFNPNWTVPPTIKRTDYLPRLAEDPLYLQAKGIKLVRAGKTMDPTDIDWASISRTELQQIKMVQDPGEGNALGRYRVLMPNPHNIYLHDTNQKSAFDGPDRAISSGCIRLSDPRKVAAFVIAHEQEWNDGRIDAVVAAGKTRDVKITQSMPVYLFYYTAWADQNGGIVYGNDLYGNDKKLLALLKEMDGYPS
ncbi:MAG: L,D-transpeptidase family protein [Alphaproteobacteria bacterium]|nr:L,D-transpeptidase family protein [Alphaproteobacteria bacterium]